MALAFDTSFDHTAGHDGSEERWAIILAVSHPDYLERLEELDTPRPTIKIPAVDAIMGEENTSNANADLEPMQPLKVEMSPQPEDGQADMVGSSLQQDDGQADVAPTAGNLGASIEMAIQIAAVVCSAPPVRIAVFCTGEDHGNV